MRESTNPASSRCNAMYDGQITKKILAPRISCHFSHHGWRWTDLSWTGARSRVIKAPFGSCSCSVALPPMDLPCNAVTQRTLWPLAFICCCLALAGWTYMHASCFTLKLDYDITFLLLLSFHGSWLYSTNSIFKWKHIMKSSLLMKLVTLQSLT